MFVKLLEKHLRDKVYKEEQIFLFVYSIDNMGQSKTVKTKKKILELELQKRIVKGLSNEKMEGKFYELSDFPIIIRENADVYRITRENGKKERKLLFIFRKNIIPDYMFEDAITAFKDQAMKTVNSRGKAGGYVTKDQVSPNVAGFVSPDKFKSRVIYKDGSISDYYVSNKVKSLIAGYYDRPKLSEKSDILKNDKIPCRTTAFTENFPEKWRLALPLIQTADDLYAKFTPETHQEQYNLASMTPQYQIDDTAFSTITVNHNWRTACHVDEGDYHNGMTVVLVAQEGDYEGGYLGYPEYGVAIDIKQGDFLLQDPHQYHCNTPIIPLTDPYTRLSMILYYRENIQDCMRSNSNSSKTLKHNHTNHQVGGALSKAPLTAPPKVSPKFQSNTSNNLKLINFESKKINMPLKLYVRPDTTDEKVIDEVLKRNVYEKPTQDFGLEAGELWFDLGGNIGTFALLALSKGCSVIIYEPEPENLSILEKNLRVNGFPECKTAPSINFSPRASKISKWADCWKIVPAAITVETRTKTANLYLSKGQNKYRHTLYHKRGRDSIEVPLVSFKNEMAKYKPDGVKIDIEGAEIDILESVGPREWASWNTQKLVFEYSFDIDNSIPRFLDIIDSLREYFDFVYYTKVKEDELVYNHFPAATIVYCQKF